MQYRGGKVLISDLHPTIYNELVNELSKNSDWKKVAEHLVQSHDDWTRRKWIDDVEQRSNSRCPPADCFLQKLMSQRCSVDNLCQILRSCDLLYAVYAIVGIEKLKITEQPAKEEVEVDDQMSMKCTAIGVPPPQYQWYHGNVEIPGETSSTLCLPITSPDQEGEYLCKVSQYDRDGKLLHYACSNCAPLVVRPTPVEIQRQSMSREVKLGDSLVLFCEARSHPSPRYQWYKDDKELPDETSNTLHKKKFKQKHTGKYHCLVWNENCRKRTEGIEVKVKDPTQSATAKIALIIANSDYQHFRELPLTVEDATSLAVKLQAMEFEVIMMQNLTLKEMKTAVDLFRTALVAGSYGLFYFAGHGCMMSDYLMLPVDVPEDFREEQAFGQQYFLDAVQDQRTTLLVGILDMCLTAYGPTPNTFKSKCYNSLVLAYSTCSYCESYEPVGAKNGFYMSQLRQHISKKKPACELFQEVSNAVKRELPPKMRKQKPMLLTIAGEPNHCLTDEVVRPELLEKQHSYLTKLIAFPQEPVKLESRRYKVSFSITIESPNPPCLNVMKLTTLGLEEWEVHFCISPGSQLKLLPMGKSCILYNLQGTEKEKLTIEIGRNKIRCDTVRFPFVKYIPRMVRGLRREATSIGSE